MTNLIKRLQDASGGSRGLSDEVLVALGYWKASEDAPGYPDGTLTVWHKPNGEVIRTIRPNPTVSLDDVVAMVPEGWSIGLDVWTGMDKLNHAYCSLSHPIDEDIVAHSKMKTTPALALCIAILKAKEMNDGN